MVYLCQQCKKNATFGLEKGRPLFCKVHKPNDTYIDVISKKCIHENCGQNASYGKKDGIREYCYKHHPLNTINVSQRYCKHDDCINPATHGIRKLKKMEYCKEHIPNDEYINISHKLCKDCNKRASFGKEGTTLLEYCAEHKLEGYINISKRTCKLCKKRARYAETDSDTAIFCIDHKPNNFVNRERKKCLYNGCKIEASFGKKGTNKIEYCSSHKPKDYISIDKTCKCCDIRPSFGSKENNFKAEYCKTHIPNNTYINVHKRKCIECNLIATFGEKDSKIPTHCKTHKPIDYVDIVHKKCIHENCETIPSFGPLFQPKTHCSVHKTKNEHRHNNPKCIHDECKEMPCFTDQNNNYPLRCEEHKLKEDINVVLQECGNCDLEYFIKNGNLCNDCSDFNNPKIRHAKELEIKQLLDSNNIIYESYDKIPEYSCNLYRPDFVIDNGMNIVIVEVDENQHQSYEKKCEEERMFNISQDFGGIPVCFIRYNPDKYKEKGKVVKLKTGRHKKLLETINGAKLYPSTELLSVVYLFYDEIKN